MSAFTFGELGDQAAALGQMEGHGALVEALPAGPPPATFLGDFVVDAADSADGSTWEFEPQLITARPPLWLAVVLGVAVVGGAYYLTKR